MRATINPVADLRGKRCRQRRAHLKNGARFCIPPAEICRLNDPAATVHAVARRHVNLAWRDRETLAGSGGRSDGVGEDEVRYWSLHLDVSKDDLATVLSKS